MLQNDCLVTTRLFDEGSLDTREGKSAKIREISVEVIGHRRHYKQLCGGMEIPCQLEFNCSNKAQMKRLKELLASKIQV